MRLVLLLLLAGCTPAVEEPVVSADDDDVVPLGGADDDDAANDDDAADDDDDAQNDDDAQDDDDFTYDPPDDFALEPCRADQVLKDSDGCVDVEHTFFTIEGLGPECPPGDRTVPGAPAWAALLETCAVTAPADLDVDWDSQSLRVMIGAGEGCACTNGTLWLQRCADGDHLGHYFYTCGPCDTPFARMTVVPISADVSTPQVHHCLPYDLRCES